MDVDADAELLGLLGLLAAGLPEPERSRVLAVVAAAQAGERAAALRGQPPRLWSDVAKSQHRGAHGTGTSPDRAA